MQENEIIIIDKVQKEFYIDIVYNCLKYAILSLPFTTDRMQTGNIKERILNITKGKIAENLFRYFCEANEIEADFNICSTPFWTVDKRDLVFDNNEWDIKNNYIYHPGNLLNGWNYTDLPTLVPNHKFGDQWSKRNINLTDGVSDVEFLFTFIKGADLTKGKRGKYFLEINLTDDQIKFLHNLYETYRGLPQNNQPFEASWLWNKIGFSGKQFYVRFFPTLIITGYANKSHWKLFKNTGPAEPDNFKDYIKPYWYKRAKSGSLNFMNSTYWATKTNASIPVSYLPSFLSRFPKLESAIKKGKLKN